MRRECFNKIICEICNYGKHNNSKLFKKYDCAINKKPNHKISCFYFICSADKMNKCNDCNFINKKNEE